MFFRLSHTTSHIPHHADHLPQTCFLCYTESLSFTIDSLFNNTSLSDVLLRVHDAEGNVGEYPAHRNVLATHSEFIEKACLGGFMEANNKTMDLQDEDPKYFEIALKWMYTGGDYETPDGMIGVAQLLFHIHVHRVADKFLMPELQEICAQAFTKTAITLLGDATRLRTSRNAVLSGEIVQKAKDYASAMLPAIDLFYSNNVNAQSSLGRAVAVGALQVKWEKTPDLLSMMLIAHPIFTQDWAMAIIMGPFDIR
ncbi:POZ domain-containing protein [Mytilinidion resinicola]|uniref:POZ domain-containing protein n=1 Tax=Mytilinidion resinicola TaxID=574789 RepID=A0A6A6ZAU3_9PEZI|nr:POZ domain-containing protein [Mytilinidion resinicola]KAF2817819.1 POZ domain-containing protein [Mytilinidion resinicola]